MAPTSALYRLIDTKIPGGLDNFVASLRASKGWQEICDAIYEKTGETVNRETLRLWYQDRLSIEVKVS